MIRPSPITRRRGMTSVLSMLYLTLFATLAVGFYGTFNASVQIAGNERNITQAQLAAESGMQMLTYHLARLSIPGNTDADDLLDVVHAQLAAVLEDTDTLDGQTIGYQGGVISLPAGAGSYVALNGDGAKFRASIERDGVQLSVKVVGAYGHDEIRRAIRLHYDVAQRASAIFDYGVASRSPIVMLGNTSIEGKASPAHGSVLSTTTRTPTIAMTGNSAISGDISLANHHAQLAIDGNCKVGGVKASSQAFADHIHYGVEEPEFPTIDTSAFEPYATNVISSSPTGGSYTNIRIKAGVNPTFTGNTTIKGVVYIETPNKVSFSGNLDLQGVIVVENDPIGDVSTNLIDFGGNVSFKSVETLPSSYGGLRDLKHSMLLAPKFKLKMRGNFGVIGGTIAAAQMEFSGNAGGTIKGSVINLEDTLVSLQGNTDIIIESQGTGAFPAGMSFGKRYVPLPDTYTEVHP